jgi:putative transposase
MIEQNRQREPKSRKTRRSINEPGHAHFLTFSCWQRLPLLNRDRSRQWMIEVIEKVRTELNVALGAYVIMPEHVHLLILPRDTTIPVRRILAALKAPVSKRAKAFLIESNQQEWIQKLTIMQGNREAFRFWQPGGGYDKNLWNQRLINNVIDYIHANPVRRGLVERPTDWMWSSASVYAGISAGPLAIDPVSVD